MRVHYVSCFPVGDNAEKPLSNLLRGWGELAEVQLTETAIGAAEDLRHHLRDMPKESLDVLIVGGHGHASRSGFWVRKDEVRWHDLAFQLRGSLPRSCSFIFYSCDGAFPGIAHIFGRETGPDVVFGPRISALAEAMCHAVQEILEWKKQGGGDAASARSLVDRVNAWATSIYLDPNDHEFLRVIWCEGPGCRHPNKPSPDEPKAAMIPLRKWGLDQPAAPDGAIFP